MRIFLKPRPKVTGRLTEYSLVVTKRFTISIHKISDPGFVVTDPHDHPSDFLSVGLKGYYVEKVFDSPSEDLTKNRDVKRRWAHVMRTTQAHYIFEAPKPAWTLFITWNYRGWGSRIYTKSGDILHPKDYYLTGRYRDGIA